MAKKNSAGAAREAARRAARGPSLNERLDVHLAAMNERVRGEVSRRALLRYVDAEIGWPLATLVQRLDEGWLPRPVLEALEPPAPRSGVGQARAGAPAGGGRTPAPTGRRQSPKTRRKALVRDLRRASERIELERRLLDSWLDRRDDLVGRLRADGASWAEVEEVAGVSRTALVKRRSRAGDTP